MYSLAVVGGPTIAPVIGAAVSQSYLGERELHYCTTLAVVDCARFPLYRMEMDRGMARFFF